VRELETENSALRSQLRTAEGLRLALGGDAQLQELLSLVEECRQLTTRSAGHRSQARHGWRVSDPRVCRLPRIALKRDDAPIADDGITLPDLVVDQLRHAAGLVIQETSYVRPVPPPEQLVSPATVAAPMATTAAANPTDATATAPAPATAATAVVGPGGLLVEDLSAMLPAGVPLPESMASPSALPWSPSRTAGASVADLLCVYRGGLGSGWRARTIPLSFGAGPLLQRGVFVFAHVFCDKDLAASCAGFPKPGGSVPRARTTVAIAGKDERHCPIVIQDRKRALEGQAVEERSHRSPSTKGPPVKPRPKKLNAQLLQNIAQVSRLATPWGGGATLEPQG
jgi:hypothetical protein